MSDETDRRLANLERGDQGDENHDGKYIPLDAGGNLSLRLNPRWTDEDERERIREQLARGYLPAGATEEGEMEKWLEQKKGA